MNVCVGGGRGGIRTHGGLAPTAVFKTAALNHSATLPEQPPHIVCRAELCKRRDEQSWPGGALQHSLGARGRECVGVIGGIGNWALLAVSATSLGSTRAQTHPAHQLDPAAPQLAQYTTYAQPSYIPAINSAWETYKIRLAALARQQGVPIPLYRRTFQPDDQPARHRHGTERAGRAHQLRSRVSALSPYLRRHVTSTLVRRGQSNYSNLYGGLVSIQSRWGVKQRCCSPFTAMRRATAW